MLDHNDQWEHAHYRASCAVETTVIQ